MKATISMATSSIAMKRLVPQLHFYSLCVCAGVRKQDEELGDSTLERQYPW
eukprot:m.192230 g.192230  ORF g.192230 m.192230 type:complete len:51 (-) comp14851_c1_seq5:435-587(-)